MPFQGDRLAPIITQGVALGEELLPFQGVWGQETRTRLLTDKKTRTRLKGLTGLTVNSCFFLPPPCVPYYIKYIYTYFYICVGGGVCIFGVLTVNLLTFSRLMRERIGEWGETGDEG